MLLTKGYSGTYALALVHSTFTNVYFLAFRFYTVMVFSPDLRHFDVKHPLEPGVGPVEGKGQGGGVARVLADVDVNF